jgi:hypothetical protein
VIGCIHTLKAKAEECPLTRPDLTLQPGPAGQIGAGRRAVRQIKVTFQLCARADISTWPPQLEDSPRNRHITRGQQHGEPRMKKFKVNLKDGEKLTFEGARLVRDGQGVHVFDENDNTVATFGSADVTSAYELSPSPE